MSREGAPGGVARSGATDAESAGLVRGSSDRAERVVRTGARVPPARRPRARRRGTGSPRAGAAAARAAEARSALRAFGAAYQDGGSQEEDQTPPAPRVPAGRVRGRAPGPGGPRAAGPTSPRGRAAGPARAARRARAGSAARRRALASRGRAASAAAAAKAAPAAAAGAKAKGSAAAKIAAALSPGAIPAATAAGAVLGFALAVLAVAQIASALFGFWTDAARSAPASGLPPYVTREMVVAALECQEEYGHPAGCTIAQIIVESGAGDGLSGLAEQDNNLFGIKWADSFAGCPEVSGSSVWGTSEEVGGEDVEVSARFTSFRSHRDCIVFRSRVLLQAERYAGNALIRRAIEEKDSDLMAEGLKDAGYATDSSYVETLKSVMATYGLYRFDGMTVEEYESGEAAMQEVLAAARSQLGVPYVWGGSTPGEALDCSGLTQYCYAQAGIPIPRTADDQRASGEEVPLSEARPGDILWREGHVGIYTGGDSYIHAPRPGDVVREATGISYFECAVRYR